MKRFVPILLLASFACASAPVAADPELKTEDEKTLYALGLNFSKQISVFKMTPAELAVLQSGISDGTLGKPPKVSLEEYGPKIQALAMQRMSAGAAAEKQKGKEYLAKIAEKPGIKKTGTGLLMETVTEGTGATPGPEANVKVNYKGTLIDGTVFDESAKYGGPSQFKLGTGLIKCWNEALTFMKVGGKAKLYCPAELAYGDRPNGVIPAGATLLFELELLEVVK
jgi:FKBP-type peptidyl-prolyl cis-trans isomerase FkpA